MNQMLISNTWFNHKTIHKITYEAEELGHKSMIDYITYTRNTRNAIRDIKAIRGAELNTWHRLVVADLNIQKPSKNRKRTYTKIKLQALEDLNKRLEYIMKVTEALEKLEEEE